MRQHDRVTAGKFRSSLRRLSRELGANDAALRRLQAADAVCAMTEGA